MYCVFQHTLEIPVKKIGVKKGIKNVKVLKSAQPSYVLLCGMTNRNLPHTTPSQGVGERHAPPATLPCFMPRFEPFFPESSGSSEDAILNVCLACLQIAAQEKELVHEADPDLRFLPRGGKVERKWPTFLMACCCDVGLVVIWRMRTGAQTTTSVLTLLSCVCSDVIASCVCSDDSV